MVKTTRMINGEELVGYDFTWNEIPLFIHKPQDNSCVIYYKQQMITSGIGTREDIIGRIPKELVDIVKYL